MMLNGKNVCDNCKSCFTCGTPKKVLVVNNVKKELCPNCYNKQTNK